MCLFTFQRSAGGGTFCQHKTRMNIMTSTEIPTLHNHDNARFKGILLALESSIILFVCVFFTFEKLPWCPSQIFNSCHDALLKYYKLPCCLAFSMKIQGNYQLALKKLPCPFRSLIQGLFISCRCSYRFNGGGLL